MGYSTNKVWAVGGVWLVALAIVATVIVLCSTVVSGTDVSRHQAFEACVVAGQHPLECEEGLRR